jgi:hypothetical protein
VEGFVVPKRKCGGKALNRKESDNLLDAKTIARGTAGFLCRGRAVNNAINFFSLFY